MTLETAETIDVHAHAVLEATMGAAGAHGPTLSFEERPKFTVANYELTGVRYRGSPFMDPDLRIHSMDQAGIDFQILSPNPLTYFTLLRLIRVRRFVALTMTLWQISFNITPSGSPLLLACQCRILALRLKS